ncbi:hypothetical protein MKW92_010108, partial [Papaver armeniacum]
MEPRNKKRTKISAPLYPNPTQQETHGKFYSKNKVISERYIDYESFPKYPISQCFGGKNMITSLLHIRGPAPISPVLLFYSQIHNLSEEDQSFDTYIEGKIHKITPNVIASVLELDRPSNPESYPPTNEDELVVSKDEFRNAVYRPEHVNCNGRKPKSEIRVTHLKPIIAVLVKIFQSNILPAVDHHYVTNLKSVYLSFLLVNGYQVDFAFLIWYTMARAALKSVRTKAVPYGIIVGRLLSYLGHPFPADTPCTSVPSTFDMKLLFRYHLPYDPCDSNYLGLSKPQSDDISPPLITDDDDASELQLALPEDPPSEFVCLSESIQSLKDTDDISPPLPPTSTVDDNASELPLALPNDPPREFVCSSESIKSLKDTMEVILSRVEQQHEEFMQQKKMIEHIAHQQHHLQQQHDEEFGQ